MARSSATTVEQFLAQLPADRRAVIGPVLDVVRRHIPAGYEESMLWGGITWSIPLARYPDTYNGQPLAYVGLAAQKHHYALYLMCAYADEGQLRRLQDGFARAGRKLDMGKSCLRFRKLEDLPLDVIGEVVGTTPPERYIEIYERSRAGRPAAKPAGTTTTARKATGKGGAPGRGRPAR